MALKEAERESEPPSAGLRGRRAAAFAVHIFTASGAVLGLLALQAAVAGDHAVMFAWLTAALVVDGVDGTLARWLRVADLLPRWSGDALDLIVDFLTYVVVPAYAVIAAGLVPKAAELPCLAAILVSSALYFADRRMKTADNYFRGFPAVWNLVAFYLFLLRPEPWLAAGAILAFAVLTFVPVVFIHPLRVRRLRRTNIVLLSAWSTLAMLALATDMRPGAAATAALSAFALYFLFAGLFRPHVLER
jgi:phosphatidylcholine synthase